MVRQQQLSRRGFIGLTAMGTAGLAACGSASEASSGPVSISGTYGIHIQGFDWGCAVDQVIVALDAPLDNVEASDFAVTETKMATDYTDPAMAQVESSVPRTVTETALSDDGKTLTLTLACGPIDGSSLEYTANMPSDGSESP